MTLEQKQLEDKIKVAQGAYYNGEPIMSDIEFDSLWDELKQNYPESTLLQEVGMDHVDGFQKHKHDIIMGSQNKANTAEEMDSFFQKNGLCIAQSKLDGCSIALEYVNGKFITGTTRGNGKFGDNVTQNVLKMKGLVKKLDNNFTGTVRGEVLLFKSDKEKYFPEMKNCRNAAAGIMKHLDGKDCDKLNIMVYDAQYKDQTSFNKQSILQNWLEKNGFNVAPWIMFDKTTGASAMEYIKQEFSEEEAFKRDYDIDGIVFKKEVIDMNDILTEYRPKSMIALKPAFTPVITVLRDIEWNVKNGTVTPIAIFDPVNIEGSTVQRASLANVSLMEELGLEIGHEITVIKANMIIPKVIKNNTTGKFISGYEF
ncbi:MAG: hypothetical protein HUJ61_07515 [Bacilli bacterium]|nr:hypothetical protein [Bacilli bacterium]